MCHTIETLLASALPFHSVDTIDDPRVKIEQQPDLDDDDDASYASDSGSCVSGDGRQDFSHGGLDRLDEVEDRAYRLIKERFLSGLGEYSLPPTVVAIHRKNFSGSFTAQAKVQSFQIHRRLLEKESPRDVNLKFAWFGTSRAGVERIMAHGFGICELDRSSGLYGRGVHLSPDDSTLESLQSADVDEDGLRHVLLCRVLLGKMEVIHPCSVQTHPSSDEFCSGTDNLQSPKKYIVWSNNMNTHILPEYVVSFKAPSVTSAPRVPVKKPTSPWMPFPALIKELVHFLPPSSVNSLFKHHKDYKERKISRSQLIKHSRQIAGDKLLMAVIKSWRAKAKC